MAGKGVASAQRVSFSKHCNFPWNAQYVGNAQEDYLKPGGIFRYIELTLSGGLTLTAANNTVANTMRGDEWGVIRKVEILNDEDETIRSFSGADLWWYNYFLLGSAPPVTAWLGAGTNAAANPTFRSQLFIPFELPRSARSHDTAWNTAGLRRIKVRVTWGTFTDINSAATAFATSPLLEVNVKEGFGAPPGLKYFPTGVSTITSNPPVAQNDYQVPLTASDGKYSQILINTRLVNQDVTGYLNSIKLYGGGVLLRTYNPLDLPAINQYERQFNGAYERALNYNGTVVGDGTEKGGYADTLKRNTKELRNSWFCLDLTDNYLSEALDVAKYNNLYLQYDVATICTLTHICSQVWGDFGSQG